MVKKEFQAPALITFLLLATGMALSVLADGGGADDAAGGNQVKKSDDSPKRPTVTISVQNGEFQSGATTNNTTITFIVTIQDLAPGTVQLVSLSGTSVASPQTAAARMSFANVDLTSFANKGQLGISATFHPNDASGMVRSNPFLLTIDTQGPELRNVETFGEPPFIVLNVPFRERDLAESYRTADNFVIMGPDPAKGPFGKQMEAKYVGEATVSPSRDTIKIPLINIPVGTYKLRLKPTAQGNVDAVLVDAYGNHAAANQEDVFSVLPGPEPTKHVAFPPFAPPNKPQMAQEFFNPGDVVVTRVARLFYMRDAHRVAEVINRNVRSYNRAAVAQAERRAEEARNNANQLTDERRHLERAAVRAAQETRRKEQELSGVQDDLRALVALELRETEKTTQQTQVRAEKAAAETQFAGSLAELENVSRQIAALRAQGVKTNDGGEFVPSTLIGNNGNNGAKANNANNSVASGQLRQLQQRRDELQTQLQPLRNLEEESNRIAGELNALKFQKAQLGGSSAALRGKTNDLQTEIGGLRQNELDRNESALQKEARESRAREDQFRKEVAAAHEDPNTYVPGDVFSQDPVTQVSISVIGEGVLQLRGPIKGINKIRTMINQMDTPLGQVKVGIHSIQVNGEKADRMEKAIQRIEGSVDSSRFLVAQSTKYLRKAVQIVAARVAHEAEMGGHYQVDRDRKYLYSFFGRDFIDELYAMNSEFLKTENKILSLHSMDIVSLNRAMFILALARNDIRQQIIAEFMQMIETELPEAEFDVRYANGTLPVSDGTTFRAITGLPEPRFRRISNRKICKARERIALNVLEKYRFRSFRGFFDVAVYDPNVMTPMQREFIRLAQIFKSQMLAEMEWKQRVIERALIEDPNRSKSDKTRREEFETIHSEAIAEEATAYKSQLVARRVLSDEFVEIRRVINQLESVKQSVEKDKVFINSANGMLETLADTKMTVSEKKQRINLGEINRRIEKIDILFELVKSLDFPEAELGLITTYEKNIERGQSLINQKENRNLILGMRFLLATYNNLSDPSVLNAINQQLQNFNSIRSAFLEFERQVFGDVATSNVSGAYEALLSQIELAPASYRNSMIDAATKAYDAYRSVQSAHYVAKLADQIVDETRSPLDHRKLLDQLIDEKEEKYIELVEGTRAHIAAVDNYLKRLAVALEDDFKTQFYDPAFRQIRQAGREWDVSLGQIERTTILNNNRAFGKVSPQATFEFDLPERDILIAEAMNGAKALATDLGALIKDPSFLAATDLLGGSSPATMGTGGLPVERSVLSGLPTDTQEHVLSQGTGNRAKLGANLEALIPPPAIYKFETGTGFEIRPVIQPDGDSIIYDFNYLYTTNVREPVRADEKHLGRVKRHFVHTQVQTSSFELREISRYLVQLKAARTAQGVPLLQDIPIAGVLFRPLPSAESALQQNLILGESTIYPTLFDLMGLRWAPHIADLDYMGLKDLEHVVRGRYNTISNFVFDEASDRVDNFLRLQKDPWKKRGFHRPDLYRRQFNQSPHHPGGYEYIHRGLQDETGYNFQTPDRRPPEMQQPPYDPLRNVPIRPEIVNPNSWEGNEYIPNLMEEYEESPPADELSAPVPNRDLNLRAPRPLSKSTANKLNMRRMPPVKTEPRRRSEIDGSKRGNIMPATFYEKMPKSRNDLGTRRRPSDYRLRPIGSVTPSHGNENLSEN